MLPFLLKHPWLTFQQNNTQPYTAPVSINYIQALPARSSDLFPIEHILYVMDNYPRMLIIWPDHLARNSAGHYSGTLLLSNSLHSGENWGKKPLMTSKLCNSQTLV